MKTSTAIVVAAILASTTAQADSLSQAATHLNMTPAGGICMAPAALAKVLESAHQSAALSTGTYISNRQCLDLQRVVFGQRSATTHLPFGAYSPLEKIRATVRFSQQICELEGSARVAVFATESVVSYKRCRAAF